MALRVVGAGLGRTATTSLKAALEQLLGGRCYHMFELFQRPDDLVHWRAAADGDAVDWVALFDDFVAIVDWPGAGFWREISTAHPDALILLSTRESAEQWWTSASETIFHGLREPTFTPDFLDHDAAMAAYERHNAAVRAEADPARLLDWRPADGWQPICDALGVAVPDDPFPRLNTSEEWVARRR
jgi:Sulfotransferase domain